MNNWELIQRFLITQQERIELDDFIINSLIIILLSFFLELTYRKCGKSLSNRASFASPFIIVGFSTMLIISIIKSSIALSLGLVGALSIVRFRTAIKEPEELAYLFLLIAMGLGIGAGLRLITLVGFIVIELIIWIRFLLRNRHSIENFLLSISADSHTFSLEKLDEIVSEEFKKHSLKRFDLQNGTLDVVYIVELKKRESLQNLANKLKTAHPDVKITFLDNKIV